jgi:hypothetical protein
MALKPDTAAKLQAMVAHPAESRIKPARTGVIETVGLCICALPKYPGCLPVHVPENVSQLGTARRHNDVYG